MRTHEVRVRDLIVVVDQRSIVEHIYRLIRSSQLGNPELRSIGTHKTQVHDLI
jgi:hypothetical protein